MGIDKSWNVALTFKPSLRMPQLKSIVSYLGTTDYSVYGKNWYELPVRDRVERGGDTFAGAPMMHDAFRRALQRVESSGGVVVNVNWSNERCGGCNFYTGNDIGKLLRILRKLGVDCCGVITGEGFQHEPIDGSREDRIYVKNNQMQQAKCGMALYADNFSSDEDEGVTLADSDAD